MKNSLKDQLKQWKKQNMPQVKQKKEKKDKALTRRDFEELMGIRRPRYERGRGGAFRQR